MIWRPRIHPNGFGQYRMYPGEIHETVPEEGCAVSLIEKDGPTLSQGGPSTHIFVPIGVKPDNGFNRYSMSQADLWRIVLAVLSEG